MATLDLDENQSQYQIRSYKPGFLRVNTTLYTRSLIVTPDQLIEDWSPQTLAELSAADFQPIIALKPDILLLGTGSMLHFPSIQHYGDLINRGIGVEIMDTGAACRTYNALSAENRRVVAALIIA